MLDSYGGYSVEKLTEVFKTVTTPGDWRGPIKATIKRTAFRLTDLAVIYFTAGGLKIVGFNRGDGTVDVEGVGYRNGPAGP